MIPDFRMVDISGIFQEVWPFFIAMAAGVLFVCFCYCIHKRIAKVSFFVQCTNMHSKIVTLKLVLANLFGFPLKMLI